MDDQRREALKNIISVRKLAMRVGHNENYISRIICNYSRPSKALARLLAHEVNSLLEEPYFNPSDFRPEDK